VTPCLLRGAKVLAPTYALTFPPTPLFSHQARRPPPGHRQAPAQGSPSLRGASRAIAPASPPAPSAVLRSRRRFAAHARFRPGPHVFKASAPRRERAERNPLAADTHPLPPPSPSLSQAEWRGLGVQQSRGWVHYAIHRPEPHIMLYRCAGSPVRDARRAPSRALFQTPPRAIARDPRRPRADPIPNDASRASTAIPRDRGGAIPPRSPPLHPRGPRSDRDAPTLTSPIFLPRFRRGRRTLNYGQPALTDAANKVNAQ